MANEWNAFAGQTRDSPVWGEGEKTQKPGGGKTSTTFVATLVEEGIGWLRVSAGRPQRLTGEKLGKGRVPIFLRGR